MADYTGSFSGSFTGSLLSTNGVISSSAQVIGSLPIGVISSSAQVVYNLPSGVISSSAQIDGGAFAMDYFDLLNLPVTITPFQANSILANSDLRDNFAAYVKYRLNAENVLSGSIEWPDIVGIPGGIISSSEQLYTTLDERYINELADGVFSSSAQVVLNDADKTGFTTDDVVEGSVNKYYTNDRVKTKLNVEGVISGSSQVDYTFIQNVPDNIVSSSNQIDYNQIQNVPGGIISSSTQVIVVDANLTDFDTDYVPEGSNPARRYYTDARVKLKLNNDGVLSGSSQVDYNQIQNVPDGIISSSNQLIDEFDIRYGNELADDLVSSSAQITLTDANNDGFDTSYVDEHPNYLYYTNQRVAVYIDNLGVISGSEQVDYDYIQNTPDVIFSSSLQVDYDYIQNVPDGLVSGSAQITLLDTDTTGLDTDVVPEGTDNLYYTNQRVGVYLNTKGVISSSNQLIDEFDIRYGNELADGLVSSSTQIDYNQIQNVPEGIISNSNQVILVDADNTDFDTSYVDEHPDYLYYTNQRVGVYIDNLGVISGSEQVDYNYIQNVPGGIISSSLQLIPEFDERYGNELADGLVSSSIQVVLTDADNTDFDTSYVEEHPNYLYYTNQRVGVYINNKGVISSSAQVVLNDADFTGFNTDDVDEGSTNLYYTNDRVKAKLNTENVVSSSQQVSDFGFIDEQQTLSIVGNTLYISNGNSVALPQQGVGSGASIWTTGSQDPNTWTYLETQNNLVVTGSFTIKGDLTVNGQSVFNQTLADDDASAVEVNGRLSMVERQINGYIASASIKIGNTRDVIDCGGFF